MAYTQGLILRIVAQRGEIGSAELLEVALKFGLSANAIRAAANRMVRTNLLEKVESGRGHVRYKIGPEGQTIVTQFITKIVRWHMALVGVPKWDGTWLVVAFSVPEGQRDKRDAFRNRLTGMGFGLLSSSVWLSPFDQEADVAALVEELGLDGMVAILHCDHIQMPGLASVGELARGVWNLAPLADHYRDFNRRVEAFVASLERAAQGKRVDAEEIFFVAVDLQNELMQMILVEDPCLPAELLPPDWPGRQAHESINTLTRTVDRLEQVSSRYDYLFHLIQGMEVLEAFRSEGDEAFHWPDKEGAR